MERLTNQERLRPWMGIVFFGVIMLTFVTVCSLMQYYWGIPGLIGTELLLALMSVAFVKIRRVKISEVFPIKKITVRDFFGCVILLISGYMFSIASILIMQLLVPSSAAEAEGISNMLYGPNSNFFYLLFSVALLPAICEEMIHRGAILSSFRGVKHEWIAIVAIGLTFSINHLSILRGPFTFIVGMILAYVVIKRNNILLSMMMHFILNSFSVILSFASGLAKNPEMAQSSSLSDINPMYSIGIALIFGGLAPVLLVTGMMLISPKTHKATRYIWSGIATCIMLFAGAAMFGTYVKESTLVNTTYSFTSDGECMEGPLEFTVDEEGSYQIVVTVQGGGDYTVIVQDKEGNVACQGEVSDGTIRTYQEYISPEPDDYEIYIECGVNTEGEHPTISTTVQKMS